MTIQVMPMGTSAHRGTENVFFNALLNVSGDKSEFSGAESSERERGKFKSPVIAGR